MILRIAALGEIAPADIKPGARHILLDGGIEDLQAAALLYGAPVRLTSAEVHAPDIPRALEWLDAIERHIGEDPRDVIAAKARNARRALTGESE